MNTHLKGLLITTLGVLFVVPDSLFIRLIEADALAIAFWRGLVAGGLVFVFVLLREGVGAFAQVLRAGRPTLGYILFFGISAPGFVLAVTMTSVANVVFILAAMPVFAAIFSRIWLREPISARMIWTMLGVFAGLGVILWGSHERAGATWQGDLVALGVSASFAAALTSVRGLRTRSMLPAVPLALIGAALLIWPFTDVMAPVAAQWPLLLGHGLFIAFAAGLMVLGPRYLSSAEVSLLILLESALAPLLVWFAIGEDPGPWALVGGAMVISVLLVSNLVMLAQVRRKRALGAV
ncbi:EamA-like transporter family protein [Roseinatronobacter thiooxidans]|uniref:EamA-like transporter family protein n=1 Tax=Roseinatronobacter thiooxidans TaxID=121821 RepID=A0A2W7R9F7_9RHOB|nr:DMT family transporter [Roseinatronobacter thiooxidans]PZX47185.1 EamA-like transporter family protein [Roseinatronobacter thiooxidans]